MCDFSDYHEQMVYSDFHARFDLSIDVSGEGKLS